MPVQTKSPKAVKPTQSMYRAWQQLLDSVGQNRFRRSDLSKVLYPLTNPRSLQRADQLADVIIRDAAKSGDVTREGHQHWKKSAKMSRKLLSGREVAEVPGLVKLNVETHCPAKWCIVDLETGHVYTGEMSGRLKKATTETIKDLSLALKKRS